MEQKNNLGNAAEDATQEQNVKLYREKLLKLAALLEENEAALNKFADLYREDFGTMLKENTSIRQINIVINPKETTTELQMKYSNRFYMLKEVIDMLKKFVNEEGRKL